MDRCKGDQEVDKSRRVIRWECLKENTKRKYYDRDVTEKKIPGLFVQETPICQGPRVESKS